MDPTLHRDCYVEADWYAREVDRVFSTQWFCIGREEEIPEPGDHLVCEVVGESVLVTRSRGGELVSYINLCRHRGSQLTEAVGKPYQTGIGATGRFKGSIQCPYHAWTYSFDGELRAAPFLEESDGLRK
ncbi:MAG TPA: Rieske (2Fe-2S) protein [Acidimicrobiia bacterium]|nr:Rieske (2Fe-2S) protein [Acidimicrobiia bacterium]